MAEELVPRSKVICENLHSAYMMDGFISSKPFDLYKALGEEISQIDIVSSMLQYASVLERFVEIAAAIYDPGYGSFPGVPDYEVSTSFGKWFCKTCISEGAIPDLKKSKEALANLVAVFFSGKADEALRTSIFNRLLSEKTGLET
jgi:hypothetical protein